MSYVNEVDMKALSEIISMKKSKKLHKAAEILLLNFKTLTLPEILNFFLTKMEIDKLAHPVINHLEHRLSKALRT